MMKGLSVITIFFLGFVLSACQNNSKAPGNLGPSPFVQNDWVSGQIKKIKASPDSVPLYDRLIDTLTNRGEFMEAAKWCQHLIDLSAEKNYYYWFVKADIFRIGKIYDSAIVAYQAYLTEFPDDEQILLNLANTYAEAADARAIELSNQIINRFQTRQMRTETAFIKGVYFNQKKEYTQARKWLDSCLLLDYRYPEAHMEKGFSYVDEGNYKDALTSFKNITTLHPGYAEGWYWKAKCHEALKQKKEAVDAYQQTLGLDPANIDANEGLKRVQGV